MTWCRRDGPCSVAAGPLSAVSVGVPSTRVRQAPPLAVDPIRHAGEIACFGAEVVRGPDADDRWILAGPIGGDGYGRN
jgi:hypothetical protein